jgi:tetratricopeptide (TPR) repeat protein
MAGLRQGFLGAILSACICLLLSVIPGQVNAKCGGDTRSLAEIYAASDAVFIGTALRVWVPYVPQRGKEGCIRDVQEALVDFRILRSWKGGSEAFITVDNSSVYDLGTRIDEGETYLVWANRGPGGRLSLPGCGRTSSLDRTPSDVQWLVSRQSDGESTDGPRLDAFSLGLTAEAKGHHAEAVQFLAPLAVDSTFPLRRDARVTLGVAYERLGRYQDAIELLVPELTLANDPTWDPRTGNAFRAEAQWSIALSLMHVREHEGALQAIDDAEKRYPSPRNCGYGLGIDEFRNELYRGLTLEHLGRYPEAVQAYLRAATGIHQDPTPALRLADLYESTGQWDKLKSVASGTDNPRLKNLRRVVQLREAEHQHDMDILFACLDERVGALWDPEVQRQNWDAFETAALIARHPAEILRGAKETIAAPWNRGIRYYTVGLTRTKEGAAILREELLKTPVEDFRTELLVYSLRVAGQPGRDVLHKLAATHLAVAVYLAKDYPEHWFLEPGLGFPPLPKEVELPQLHLDPGALGPS